MAPSDQVFIDLASDEILEDQKKPESEVVNDLAATMSQEKYSALLGRLCDEAFFLVDEETRKKLPTLVPDHQDWVQCVSILQALGINSGAGLEKLRIALRGVDTHSPLLVDGFLDFVIFIKSACVSEKCLLRVDFC